MAFMEWAQWIGDMHPRLVPFPVVLLLTALVLDALGLIRRHDGLLVFGKIFLGLGTVFLLFTFVSGICEEVWAGRAGVPHHQIKSHELIANIAAWGFIGLTAWRLFLDSSRPRSLLIYLGLGVLLYSSVALTGYLGGKLVSDYGANVAGADAHTVLSAHDLNTLAQRQTDRNLDYSKMMHNVSGAMVMILALAVFMAEVRPSWSRWLKRVPAGLLFVGGVLLFFFADLDLYDLDDPRQWTDREVQLHKVLSTIMAGIGLFGVLAGKGKDKQKDEAAARAFQNKVIAVMALIGGGALLTHIHTVAPYANVAAGLYLSHVLMGAVALAIGLVKLADGPGSTGKRWLTYAFPGLLAAQAILLMTYTEGLPTWAGGGLYNRWGPNGGTIAHFGPYRAELTHQAESEEVEVRFYDRHSDEPYRIDAELLDLIIYQRYRSTHVPLTKVPDSQPDGFHFRGSARFLAEALTFDAALVAPVKGQNRKRYFDPWVIDYIVGIPINEEAAFHSPMHEGVERTGPGTCPISGMELIPIRPKRSEGLHDLVYEVELAVSADQLEANTWTTLHFTPYWKKVPGYPSPPCAPSQSTADRGKMDADDLEIAHGSPFHLIVVNTELTYFDHVHPEPEADGSYRIDYRFPDGGDYVLFADVIPHGDRPQAFRFPLSVGGPASDPLVRKRSWPERRAEAREFQARPLAMSFNPRQRPDSEPLRNASIYHTGLLFMPRQLAAEREAHLTFHVSHDGQPVQDLEPYLGAMGHCVIISEDTEEYLHSHPMRLKPEPEASERGGPAVSFHTYFRKPGRYKVWGQFKRGDDMIVAEFSLDVKAPILPRPIYEMMVAN